MGAEEFGWRCLEWARENRSRGLELIEDAHLRTAADLLVANGGKFPVKLYTSNPNERNTQVTTPLPADVIAMLKSSWPELTDAGTRVLTAQFLHETGGGKYCFNWNLGNVKALESQPHMYLANVWEVLDQQRALSEVGALAEIADEPTCERRGWAHPPGTVVVVFQPAHAMCRFRAYDSLIDGARQWVGTHRRIAVEQADYLRTVNAGDCAGAAHLLKLARYYTGDESAYARSMAAEFATLPTP